MSLADLTNAEHAALTEAMATKASRCGDPTATPDDALRSVVGMVIADCSLIARGTLTVDAVSQWFK